MPSIISLDALRCANLLVKNLGQGALQHADQRRRELEKLPDLAGVAMWQQVKAAIQVLCRAEQTSGELLQ